MDRWLWHRSVQSKSTTTNNNNGTLIRIPYDRRLVLQHFEMVLQLPYMMKHSKVKHSMMIFGLYPNYHFFQTYGPTTTTMIKKKKNK